MKTAAKKLPHLRRRRSASSLMASGVATFTLTPGKISFRIQTTDEALREDGEALKRDAKRAYKRLQGEFKPA
ncbi:MAG: hypothetical protein QOG72_2900 [Sphingomonadales bacterium]|jgi:hypothetical protein|nr:hypothetical protein [Sphingomonadales bacterium]